MQFSNNILDVIGNTPLIKLNKVVPESAATILAKCDFLNPTGSMKDRMAAYIIEQAEKDGKLQPGGTIIENTSGNTGLALAMVAAVKGYKCIFTMPDKMSQEKRNMLKAFGAELIITPTDVPGNSSEHYVQVAKRLAEETANSFYVDQYNNLQNTEAHYHSTGREIWEQTGGELDAYIAAVGTGGTCSGAARYLKEKNQSILAVGVDPVGSVHYDLFHHNKLIEPQVYKVEGMGEDIPCAALDFSVLDDIRQVNDQQCFDMARRLVKEEGLFCGGSSGGVIHVAIEIAKELGRGQTVVAVIPESGSRYISKFLSDDWMKENAFLK